MVDQHSKIVLQKHALRAGQARAALLHGSRHNPADLRRPTPAIWAGLALAGLVIAVVIVLSALGIGGHRTPRSAPPAEAVPVSAVAPAS